MPPITLHDCTPLHARITAAQCAVNRETALTGSPCLRCKGIMAPCTPLPAPTPQEEKTVKKPKLPTTPQGFADRFNAPPSPARAAAEAKLLGDAPTAPPAQRDPQAATIAALSALDRLTEAFEAEREVGHRAEIPPLPANLSAVPLEALVAEVRRRAPRSIFVPIL